MALILAAVMAVSCLTTILLAASKPWTEIDLGSLSQYYETGTNADPGRISNVDGDSGGTSYGLYMFVEKTVTSFMDWLKKSDSAVYRGFGDRLYNAYAYNTSGQYYPGFGSNFKNTWQEIGRNNRTEFAQAQTDFWRDTQYTQLVANVEGQYKGFDIDNYSNALKNVFWSRSVHHGVGATYGSTKNTDGMSGATGVICRAFKSLGGFNNQSEAELIAAIYAECSRLDTNGKWKEDNMETLTAKKYGIYGRSMAYFNINSGGVQTSVYSRLHVNEPADALVMRYTHSDPDIPEGKYTLLYNNNGEQNHGLGKSVSTLTAAADAMMLRLTYYNNGYYILTNDDGQRLSVSGGKLVLEAPSTSNNQFWILSSGSGYTLQNVGTKQYVTVTVTSADVTADGQKVPTKDERVAAIIAAANSDEEGALGDSETRFNELLAAEVATLTTANLKGKAEDEIAADIAEMEKAEEDFYDYLDALGEDAVLAKEQQTELKAKYNAYISAVEKFTGKKMDEIVAIVAEKLVTEQMAAEAETTNPTTTVTTYTVGMTDASDKAARWALNKATGRDAWTLTGLFYPGYKDSDGIGGTISHVLTEDNSSFPLRGVVSCTQGIRTVVVEVSKVGGSGGFTATGNGSGKTWFDLWELDSQATFSLLEQGSYTMTISGTGSDGKEEELLSTGFTVGAKDSNTPSGLDKEEYTVTFMNGNTQVVTKTYSLGDVYGKLPEVSGAGFVGWFTKDGRQVYENSMVAAENHTLSAQFGTLYTVSFKVDGKVIRSRQLSANDLIVAPSNPVKAADKNYVYSFSHWVDGSGNRFVENMTYMPAGNVTYTAVFTKTANSGGGTGGGTGGSTGGNTGTNTPTPSGNYLTGVSPSTSVSAMNSAGYTIYSGSTKVTSGLVGTGMTAVSSSATVTIVVTGDVSGDGKITITDVVKLQKYVVGSNSLSGAYAKAADINGDGKVTITDVVQAAQVTVGQRTIG